MATVSVRFDGRAVKARLLPKIQRAQMLLDQQVAADSNYFCPEDKGDLKKSVYLSSKMGSGLLTWGVVYARRLYHGIGFIFSKDKNPSASAKWYERAKAVKLPAWIKLVNDEYRK